MRDVLESVRRSVAVLVKQRAEDREATRLELEAMKTQAPRGLGGCSRA